MTMKLVFKGDNVINNQFLQKWSNRNNVSTIKNFITFSTIQHVASCEWWIKVVGLCGSRSLPLTTCHMASCGKSCEVFYGTSIFPWIYYIIKFSLHFDPNCHGNPFSHICDFKKNKMVLKKEKNTHTHICGWSWLVHWGFMAYLCIFCFF